MPPISSQERILDDKNAILALDRSGLFKEELRFPRNLREAVSKAKTIRLLKGVKIGRKVIRYAGVRSVVVAGMGGSAITGDILKDWVGSEVKVPIETCRGYHLPAYVDEDSLVFVLSYSGDTEETLSCLVDAAERGCKIVSVSSGGALRRAADALGLPFIQLPKMAAARASLPYLFAPLPYLLTELGILSSGQVDRGMEDTVKVLDELAEEYAVGVPVAGNFAKKTAIKVYGTVPVVYCYDAYRSAGLRFKTQLNENCKLPARFDVFPELNHNEVIGWEASSEITKQCSLILLRGVEELPEVRERIEVLKERVFCKKARSVIEIIARGETRLARIFSLIFTADMISMYLAVLYNRDPMASEIFPLLKQEVTERLGTLRRLEDHIRRLAVNH